jgi:hypothetical protein
MVALYGEKSTLFILLLRTAYHLLTNFIAPFLTQSTRYAAHQGPTDTQCCKIGDKQISLICGFTFRAEKDSILFFLTV